MTVPARRRGTPAPEHWFGAGYLPTWQVYPSALLAHWRYRGAHRVKRGSVRVGDIEAALWIEAEKARHDELGRQGIVAIDGERYFQVRARIRVPDNWEPECGLFVVTQPTPDLASPRITAVVGDD